MSKVETLTWTQVNRQFKTVYASVLSLFDLILSIPATNVAYEREFTHMKLVKLDRRTHLTEGTLSDCLMIKSEGTSIKDFNPDPAISVWFQKIERWPGTSGSQENKQSKYIFYYYKQH